MSQKIATYAAAAMLVIGAIYLVRNMPQENAAKKSKDVTATTKEGSLTTTPIKTSAVAALQTPLSVLMAKGRQLANLFIPSSVDQHRNANPFGAVGGSQDTQTSAYRAPLRPEYRTKALAGGKGNVIALPGNTFTPSNV